MNIDRKSQWQGYTLEELRMKRIVNLTRIEIERAKLMHIVDHYTANNNQGGTSLIKKVTGAFDLMDYGVIAFKVMRSALSLFRRFRRKK